MSTSPVLLVHGAWAKGWAWGYVRAELEKRGVASMTVDLPSGGQPPPSWPTRSPNAAHAA